MMTFKQKLCPFPQISLKSVCGRIPTFRNLIWTWFSKKNPVISNWMLLNLFGWFRYFCMWEENDFCWNDSEILTELSGFTNSVWRSDCWIKAFYQVNNSNQIFHHPHILLEYSGSRTEVSFILFCESEDL